MKSWIKSFLIKYTEYLRNQSSDWSTCHRSPILYPCMVREMRGVLCYHWSACWPIRHMTPPTPSCVCHRPSVIFGLWCVLPLPVLVTSPTPRPAELAKLTELSEFCEFVKNKASNKNFKNAIFFLKNRGLTTMKNL